VGVGAAAGSRRWWHVFERRGPCDLYYSGFGSAGGCWPRADINNMEESCFTADAVNLNADRVEGDACYLDLKSILAASKRWWCWTGAIGY
jgi:hypothetical protein